MFDLAYIKYATKYNGPQLCLLSLAVFGPNICCNYKKCRLKKLTLFTTGFPAISYAIGNNSNDIDYCPNNSSLDRYTQNVVLDIFEEVSEVSPTRSFFVVNVVYRLFNSAKNYIIKPKVFNP